MRLVIVGIGNMQVGEAEIFHVIDVVSDVEYLCREL
jgi:hypothetical protein